MKTITTTFVLISLGMASIAQDLNITFSASGAASRVETVTATNQRTNESVVLPGGETLTLTLNSGIPVIQEEFIRGSVFPNPFPGQAVLRASALQSEAVMVKLQNLQGQVLAQARELIRPGQNEFELTVSCEGIYLVSLISETERTAVKILCTESTGSDNRIQYLGIGSGSFGDRSGENLPAPGGVKSSQQRYSLGYSPGDIIHFRCGSGIYTTMITDTPTDSRNYDVQFHACTDTDGRSYSVINLGEQAWMAENLAYLPSVSPPDAGSETSPSYYVYGYTGSSASEARKEDNYSKFGVLYNWPAAMASCPPGWHLPSDAEWTELIDYLSGRGFGYGGSGNDIGKSIASAADWGSNSVPGTVGHDLATNNRSGFTTLPGGYRKFDGGFISLNYYADFWTSTEAGAWFSWFRELSCVSDTLPRYSYYRSFGFSVRCVKNK